MEQCTGAMQSCGCARSIAAEHVTQQLFVEQCGYAWNALAVGGTLQPHRAAAAAHLARNAWQCASVGRGRGARAPPTRPLMSQRQHARHAAEHAPTVAAPVRHTRQPLTCKTPGALPSRSPAYPGRTRQVTAVAPRPVSMEVIGRTLGKAATTRP